MRSSKDNVDWSTERIDRMVRTRHLEDEQNGLYLLDHYDTPALVGDFGSGIGRRRIYFPDSEYIGFDRAEVMIENAREYFPDYDIRMGDITQIDSQYPELAGSFDMILTYAVVQYNFPEEQEAIYNCIHRCLKTGGLYYWRENKNDTLIPSVVLDSMFEQLEYDGQDQRVFRSL